MPFLCAFAACSGSKAPPAAAPAVCPSVTTASSPAAAQAERVVKNPIDKLNAQTCTREAFGCGSCVTHGVWGILWVENDCSRHCDSSCGSEPASSAVTLAPLVAGPSAVEMKLTLPSEVIAPKKADTPPKKVGTKKASLAEAAASVNIVEKSTAFSYFASRASINCGPFGPTNGAIACNPPDMAECTCEVAGAISKATCTCKASSSRLPASNNCKVEARSHVACAEASVAEMADPGCATNCAPGSNGVCAQATCAGGTWAQSLCVCERQPNLNH